MQVLWCQTYKRKEQGPLDFVLLFAPVFIGFALVMLVWYQRNFNTEVFLALLVDVIGLEAGLWIQNRIQ